MRQGSEIGSFCCFDDKYPTCIKNVQQALIKHTALFKIIVYLPFHFLVLAQKKPLLIHLAQIEWDFRFGLCNLGYGGENGLSRPKWRI